MDLHLNAVAPRSAVQTGLDQCLQRMGRDYRDPNVLPFHAEDLVRDYNACIPPALQLQIGRPQDAMEFLIGGGQAGHGGLLGQLGVAPNFLQTYLQQGTCNTCNQAYQQVGTGHCLGFRLISSTLSLINRWSIDLSSLTFIIGH